ncbi:MAG: hypothetical protein IJ831_08845 [Spirochaetales bacterium]|nr:hypothetical protein [Spirochaetales bacterium]
MKCIVIYYSKSGKTEELAERIAADLSCPKVRIETEESYGNYVSSIIRAGKELRKGVVSAVRTAVPDLSEYDVILLGYPIWYGSIPSFVSKFIADCNTAGKTIIPFATFTASDISKSVAKLEEICPDAEIKHPFNYGRFKKDDYHKWIIDIQK